MVLIRHKPGGRIGFLNGWMALVVAGHHRQLSGSSILRFADLSAVIHDGPHRAQDKIPYDSRVYSQ